MEHCHVLYHIVYIHNLYYIYINELYYMCGAQSFNGMHEGEAPVAGGWDLLQEHFKDRAAIYRRLLLLLYY